jgi:hypothetical protein
MKSGGGECKTLEVQVVARSRRETRPSAPGLVQALTLTTRHVSVVLSRDGLP